MSRIIARTLRLTSLLLAASAAQAETKLLRFPDLSATQVTFVYAGDIYITGRDGGAALRLTAHPGQELYPKFSPDGKQIAFSAEYNGTRQVYVMPSTGGAPRQLTWYSDVGPLPVRGGTDYRVLDWMPDGSNVVVRANRLPFDERGGRPYLVPVAGGMETPLAIPESGGGMMSPDGKSMVYTPIDREFRSWKRYRGGRAQDVWTYDLVNNRSHRLTTFRGTDHQPMWIGDAIYFASDRTPTMNLYRLPATGDDQKDTPQALTTFTDFDVLWPSAGPDGIVFEQGGSIWRFDVAQSAAHKLDIHVVADIAATLPTIKNVTAQIESFGISPNGKRVLFGARGELFTVPAKNGVIRNISHTPAEREISASWSPDGKSIAYLSDATGEYEIYLRSEDGAGKARRISTDGDTWRNAPVWSPDSRMLAFTDQRHRLRIIDIATGKITDADQGKYGELERLAWAPDSRYVAYEKTGASNVPTIWLYGLDTAKAEQLLSDTAPNSAPAFDPKGRYLYFISNRDFNLTNSAYEFNYLYTHASRIYAASLNRDGPSLTRIDSDEAVSTDDKEAEASGHRVTIDVAGFETRVVALAIPAGNLVGLQATKDGVLYLNAGDGDGGDGDGERGATLNRFFLSEDKPREIATGVSGFALSANEEKLLLRQGPNWSIIAPKAGEEIAAGKLDLTQLDLRIDPRVEWRQMFVDAWRILRDWFYDENMHGGIERWNAVRDRYLPLVDHVASRADLDYLLHELAGEANSGHVYVEGGDRPQIERHGGGFLGAELEADASGYFRIGHIFPGENWSPDFRSPLTEPGVNVASGEYLISVDGVDARSVKNAWTLFEGKADRVSELRISATPNADAARLVRVRLQNSEQSLRYLDWVQARRAIVDRLSGGRIGYVHLPNTAVEGNRELMRGFLAYAHKDALIIDDRYNGGGFIPDRMVEMLARQPLSYWKRRGLEPTATPLLSHVGPKAMLINGLASSGGDALPYYFRALKLGPLIGTRTWGGLIGISGNPGLADGGMILAATFRFMDPDGKWAVENEGVAPDVEVIDLPEAIHAGHDPSLEKAIEMLLKELEASPRKPVVAPPAPSRFE